MEEADEVDTGDGLEISSAFAQHIKAMLNISESPTSASTSRKELDSRADSPVVGKTLLFYTKLR